jgi:serine/threonine protein kinase
MSESGGRKFYLQERLGAGAFGEVYLAEQDSGAGFRKRVALKVLNAHVQGFAEAGRRMRDEARILGRLSHRNIVSVHDLVKLGEQWAVVMDYVPGADLERMVEALLRSDEQFPVASALEIGAAVADAMHGAFVTDDGKGGTLGVVHRDIKPSNVLVTPDGDVKVLDFGVARVNLETRESRTGLRVGTERYMSPQRICGDEDGLAGDVYALGATLAELILRDPMGRTPVEDSRHAGFVEEIVDRLRDHLQAPPEVVEELLALIGRCLALDVDKRPQPRELADSLLALSRKMPGETLIPFARRFVPQVDKLLDHRREPISGVLSESGTRTTASSMGESSKSAVKPVKRSDSDTPDASITFDPNLAEARAASAPGGRGLTAVVLILGVVLGLGAIAFGTVGVVLVFGLGASNSVAEVTPAPIVPPPTPPPVVVAPVDPPVAPPPVEPPPTAPVEPPPVAPVAPPATPVVATPRPPKPKPTEPPPPVVPAVDPNAPLVNRALVVMSDASSLNVKCGGVSANGTASARITNFPAGKCSISATFVGRTLTGTVAIDHPTTITCTANGDSLSCS